MAGRDGLAAVLPLLLLLLSAAWSIAGAAPSWDDPLITADVNDNFTKDVDEANSVITIYEDVPITHKIGVLHIVADPGDTVEVTQTSGVDDVVLSFDGSETEQNVYIQSKLDRETTDSINVAVQLNGASTKYFVITVADVNDNRPMFDGDQGSQISLDVPENKPNDSLLILTATDADVGATATLTYSLDTNGHNDTFQLKSLTKDGNPACQLQLLKELDFETRPLYKMTITVKDTPDDRGTVQTSSVTVFVNVEDEGDTPPKWLIPPMARDKDEDTPKGSELFTVEAFDGDTSVDNDIRYSITSQTPDGFVEMLDATTGKVTLKKDLDREDLDLTDGFITIDIQAREAPADNPEQPCSNITCVSNQAIITVNDLDDEDPEFGNTEYAANWTEGNSGVLGLAIDVTDKDKTPANNQIALTIEGTPKEGVFELTSTSGVGSLLADIRIVDRNYLDYEDESKRTTVLKVVATGNEPRKASATATVTITLEDLNDNDPVFTEKSYTKNVSEIAKEGTTVITVTATDADSSSQFGNESIRYALSGGGRWSESIDIDPTSGEITLAKDSAFDYDDGANSPIKYTIQATDNGGSEFDSRTATATLTINVIDVDDTPPQLHVQSDAEVLEQKAADITADISASDKDGMSQLKFSFDWKNTVAKKDGKVVEQSDYDYTSMFQLTAQEHGEDTVAQLSVVGPDLDREMIDTVTLRITVTDTNTEAGDDADQGDITVNILDINDNAPEFVNVDSKTLFNVTENMPKTSTINQAILARDKDQNHTITYSLTGAGVNLVAIGSSSGQLSVKDSIDREKIETIFVTVTATDSGVPAKSSTIDISIEVLDQNDNGPEWVEVPSDQDDLTVMENKQSADVYTLKASDEDKPDTDASNITYSLSEDGKKNFTVDPQSGDITVNGILDREWLADQNYIMTIQVFAGDACDEDGNCAHKKEGLLRVTVLDDNDCPPVFPVLDDFLVEAVETSKKGGQLATVRATDADKEGTNASRLTYALGDVLVIRTGCEGKTGLFLVETDKENNQAIIKANRDLQGCWGDYNITLKATDGEEPENTGTGVYKVRIKDNNDAPNITWPTDDKFGFELPEDTFENTRMPVPLPNGTAMQVFASDPDDPETDNAKLIYRLLSSSTPDDATSIFDVNSSNGTVMLLKGLDRESPSGYRYTLVVEVKDFGESPLTDTVRFAINISDVDEFPPKFVDRNNNDTKFTEENPAKSDVKDITSLAKDEDATDIIFYFLVGGDTDVFELVDSTAKTPQLRNLQKLNREKKGSYHLIMQTTRENKQPPHVNVFDPSDLSQLNLTVIVDDINDMTPNFGNRRFMGGIAEKDPQGPILRLESDDPDLNDQTTYSITSDFTTSDPSISNISQPFKLDNPDTASLLLNFDVSEGMDGYFDFQITAEDRNKQHTNTTNVRIFIIIQDDRVKFVFGNPYLTVQAKQDEIADILTKDFSDGNTKYVANIETVTAATCDNDTPCTNMIAHFIDDDKEEPVLADVIINLQFQGHVTDNLVRDLGALGLDLTAIGDTTVVPPEDDETVFQMLLIVVGSVLGGILAITCITSCLHTHKLRRQVKALSINAFGSRESGMQNAGLMVPGSNLYANQGANPIYTNDDKKPIDAESVSSGDSVLIGVEDAPEFAAASRPGGPKRPTPSAPPLQTNPAFQPDFSDPDDVLGGHHDDLVGDATPAVFDENSHHHMPAFEPDDDDDVVGGPQFGGGAGGVTQNPLFGAGGGGSTQNPLFGAEMTSDGDLGGADGMF